MGSLGEEKRKTMKENRMKSSHGKIKGGAKEKDGEIGEGRRCKRGIKQRERGRKIMKALKDRSVSVEIYSKKMRGATSR